MKKIGLIIVLTAFIASMIIAGCNREQSESTETASAEKALTNAAISTESCPHAKNGDCPRAKNGECPCAKNADGQCPHQRKGCPYAKADSGDSAAGSCPHARGDDQQCNCPMLDEQNQLSPALGTPGSCPHANGQCPHSAATGCPHAAAAGQ